MSTTQRLKRIYAVGAAVVISGAVAHSAALRPVESRVTAPSAIQMAGSEILSAASAASRVSRVQLKATTSYPNPRNSDEVLASRFDLTIFQAYWPGQSSANQIKRLKTLNPALKVLVYYHSWGQWDWQPDWSTLDAHEDWFVHDVSGRRVKSGERTVGAWLMNLGNAEYRAYVRTRIVDLITQYGFDGLFEDGPITTVRHPHFKWSGSLPDSVKQAWHGWAITHVREMREALGARLYITNTTPWAPDSSIPDWMDTAFLPFVDGTMMEGFAHAYWQSDSETINESWWKWQMSQYHRNLSRGKIAYLLSGVNSKVPEEIRRWQIFTLASYLLKADGKHAYYNWHYQGHFPEMDVDLGEPMGADYYADGVFQRAFRAGRVFVNPSSASRTVRLPPGFMVPGLPAGATQFTLEKSSAVIAISR